MSHTLTTARCAIGYSVPRSEFCSPSCVIGGTDATRAILEKSDFTRRTASPIAALTQFHLQNHAI